MTLLETAEYIGKRRGHTGQRLVDFTVGYVIAHNHARMFKAGSVRQCCKFGHGRVNRQINSAMAKARRK